ncbi:hypothetical protein [Streptomyces sp. CBMA152]|uniref:hypothetical protein n=1 Tax=Streptomyces sp. CBMA152 TaxID=1896312 RepID=UPI001660C819|nr:hypothetical protein [Streptomyces sp. CBMA152]MBD0743510.1 hypothetical protein [Streptomyces sp. CBMA152]
MSHVQPAFDGTEFAAPAPAVSRRSIDDYEAWESIVRPVFVEVAKAGRPFLCWKVAQQHDLPEPPSQKLDWARLMASLHRDHIIRCDGFGLARDKSACRRWRGTTEAMQGRAA